MDCTPSALAEASKCLCLDNKTLDKAEVILLCWWANGFGPVVETSYLLDERLDNITDADGNKIVVTH